MTPHEQTCFNDALHKLKVRDAELRIRRLLDQKLRTDGMRVDDQLPHLNRIEQALRSA